MAKKIENVPSPDILMNSMRSIGYSFKTALADIVDNSISAGARQIDVFYPIGGNEELFISILDDGEGMNDEELFNAMKYGSPRDGYGVNDLGRFGLGLKSASLSQCKVLTVASKKDGIISCYQWDLDEVAATKKWNCKQLDNSEINLVPNINELKQSQKGTIVIWQNFDVAYKKSDGFVSTYLSEQLDTASDHLRLVFQRFINNGLKIRINGHILDAIDPFLEKHPKTDIKTPSSFRVIKSDPTTEITVQSYILPHQNDLNNEDIEKLGGMDELREGQGFYVYRNNRLIIYGTWFRLSSQNLSSELYKYGRIKVDIPNSLDDMWEIDVKKQNAVIPKQILNLLKKKVADVKRSSTRKVEKRTKLTYGEDPNKIWNKGLSRNEKDHYYINPNSTFVLNFLNQFEDKDRSKILRFIEVISSSLPFDDIYNSICNKKNETQLSEEQLDTLVMVGVSMFEQIRQIRQCTNEKAFEILCQTEPFNNEVVSAKVWERVNHD